MKHLIFILFSSCIFFTSYALADGDVQASKLDANVQSEKMAELSAADDEDVFTLAKMTCKDVFNLFDDATPGENKDPEDVINAQDDVFDLITWLHGYLSGRDGIGSSKYKLNKAGIEKAVADMAAVCKPNLEKRFLDVVPTIK